ncbi:lipid-binding SYLF domain-containing protein [Bizionia arctica]|uniref:Ysc84 actin-binding domain-containing protein n=1 Tax=Bizionia arctica TaxID=1495645 RepID=A0A917GV46_9FLAO|nr:lipid-binding SYLF domain-containing protein [Bizionia arctica]GGG58197.1 hypothetical protein GCM10010976_31310 [Bizionia arctica]
MKTLKTIMAVCLLLITVGVTAQNSKDKEVMADAQKAKTALLEKDPGLEKFFDTASGYVIFPSIGKGALIIGGAMGNGVVYENGVAIGMSNIKKLSVGIQAGGQALTEVIFFETDEALNEFKQGNYEFAAQASAVIADKGVSEDANYDDNVIVFAMPKAGLMAETSVGGQKFEYHPFK